MPDNLILSLRGIEKSFRAGKTVKPVLRGVELELRRGEMLGLVGESGCGKSTLVNVILRILSTDRGHIVFEGRDITQLSFREMLPLRRQLQAVFQSTAAGMDPRMKIRRMLTEPLRNFRIPYTEEDLLSIMETVALPSELLDRRPGQLSGGQKQRAAIARALLPQPELILFDEVTSNLDTVMAQRIAELIRSLQAERALSCIFVTHDVSLALAYCDRIAVMRDGRILETFAPRDEAREEYTRSLLESVSFDW